METVKVTTKLPPLPVIDITNLETVEPNNFISYLWKIVTIQGFTCNKRRFSLVLYVDSKINWKLGVYSILDNEIIDDRIVMADDKGYQLVTVEWLREYDRKMQAAVNACKNGKIPLQAGISLVEKWQWVWDVISQKSVKAKECCKKFIEEWKAVASVIVDAVNKTKMNELTESQVTQETRVAESQITFLDLELPVTNFSLPEISTIPETPQLPGEEKPQAVFSPTPITTPITTPATTLIPAPATSKKKKSTPAGQMSLFD